MEFGVVPADVVEDLQNIGNWKARALAIDRLHKALADARLMGPGVLLPHLDGLMDFILKLVGDPNFKISLSAMNIMALVVQQVGQSVSPHLRRISNTLIEKLGDTKLMVRQVVVKVAKKLMLVLGPQVVLDELQHGMHSVSWRTREELVNLFIMVMLSYPQDQLNFGTIVAFLTKAMADTRDRVCNTALEALALVHSKLGSDTLDMLTAASGLTCEHRTLLSERLKRPVRITLSSDGFVEHLQLDGEAFAPQESTRGEATGSRARAAVDSEGCLSSGLSGAAGPPESVGISVSGKNSRRRPGRLVGAGSAHGMPAALARTRSCEHHPSIMADRHTGRSAAALTVATGKADGTGAGLAGLAAVHSGPLSLAVADSEASGCEGRRKPGRVARDLFGAKRGCAPRGTDGSEDGSTHDSASSKVNCDGFGATDGPVLHATTAARSLRAGSRPRAGLAAAAPEADTSLGIVGRQVGLPAAEAAGSAVGGGSLTSNHIDLAAELLSAMNGSTRLALRPSEDASDTGPLGDTAYGLRSEISGIGRSKAAVEAPPGKEPAAGLTCSLSLSRHSRASSSTLRDSPWRSPSSSFGSDGASLALLRERWAGKPREDSAASNTATEPRLLEPDKPFASVGTAAEHVKERLSSDACVSAGCSPRNLGEKGAHSFAGRGAAQNQSSGRVGASVHCSIELRSQAEVPELLTSIQDQGSARYATMSPTKHERLANLKRRQQDRRAYSASAATLTSTSGPNGESEWDSPGAINDVFGPDRGAGERDRPAGLTQSRTDRLMPQQAETGRSRQGSLQGGCLSRTGSLTPSPSGRSSSSGIRDRLHSLTAWTPGKDGASASGSESPPLRVPASPGSGPACLDASRSLSRKSGPPDSTLQWYSTAELPPLDGKPEDALREATTKLQKENLAKRKDLDWQGQYSALLLARRLVQHHPDVVRSGLHELVLAAAPVINALRSQIAKAVLQLVQEMFWSLGRVMDRELDELVPILAKKAGEMSNAGRDTFLAHQADIALSEMIRSCSEARVLAALLGCAGSKSSHVRLKAASHIDAAMETASARLVNHTSLVEKIFKTAAGFLEEGAQETRTYGKRIIWHLKTVLSNQAELDRLLSTLPLDRARRKVQEALESSNGPPTPPSRGLYTRLNQQGSSGSSNSPGSIPTHRSSSGGSQSDAGPLTPSPMYGAEMRAAGSAIGAQERRRRSVPSPAPSDTAAGVGEQSRGSSINDGAIHSAEERVQELLVGAPSRDWRERCSKLQALAGMKQQLRGLSEATTMAVLEHIATRMADGNSKVAFKALQTLAEVVPECGNGAASSLHAVFPALAVSLGSSHDHIRSAAVQATDALLESIDAPLLVHSLAHCVSHGSLRGKPYLLERMAGLAQDLWVQKPGLVTKHLVATSLSLLGEANPDVRSANSTLLRQLGQLMGPQQLKDHAATFNAPCQARLQSILDGSRA